MSDLLLAAPPPVTYTHFIFNGTELVPLEVIMIGEPV